MTAKEINNQIAAMIDEINDKIDGIMDRKSIIRTETVIENHLLMAVYTAELHSLYRLQHKIQEDRERKQAGRQAGNKTLITTRQETGA